MIQLEHVVGMENDKNIERERHPDSYSSKIFSVYLLKSCDNYFLARRKVSCATLDHAKEKPLGNVTI